MCQPLTRAQILGVDAPLPGCQRIFLARGGKLRFTSGESRAGHKDFNRPYS